MTTFQAIFIALVLLLLVSAFQGIPILTPGIIVLILLLVFFYLLYGKW